MLGALQGALVAAAVLVRNGDRLGAITQLLVLLLAVLVEECVRPAASARGESEEDLEGVGTNVDRLAELHAPGRRIELGDAQHGPARKDSAERECAKGSAREELGIDIDGMHAPSEGAGQRDPFRGQSIEE